MKNFYTKGVTFLIAFLCFSGYTYGQDTTAINDMYSMSLEDLMNIEIKVASKNKMSVRESPGIISVITAEQIQKMGARDLIDVLRLVPGFQFGADVQGVVGAGIRGNWAHEGKMSVQIDGLEVNETLFSTTQFGNHFPVDHIKRIEIIRGPGSALYGGYAELGVINIITRESKDVDGVAFGSSFSEMEKTFNQRNISLSYGKKINEIDVSLHTYLGTGNRSERTYTGLNADYDGFETYQMKDNSGLQAMHMNLAVSNGAFKNRIIYDHYNIESRDAFDAITAPFNMKFNTLLLSSEYTFEVNDKLSFTPEFIYKKQLPWNNINENSKDAFIYYDVTAQRTTGRISANYNFNDNLNIIIGGEMYRDEAEASTTFDYFYPVNDYDSAYSEVKYMNYAAFTQLTYKWQYADFVAGARFEENSAYGSSFVPRFAVTKAFEKFHYKALFSQAFRTPGIANINANLAILSEGIADFTEIEPEKTTVFEIELGYKIGSNLLITGNFFDITIDKPIVYFYDDDLDIEGYQNYDQSGTRGFEFDVRYSAKWGNINATYSHYMQGDKNKIETYEVPEDFDSEALIGFARDKATLIATFNLMKNLSISPWVVYTGKKYGWAPVWDEAEDDAVWDINNEFDPTINFNLFVSYNNLFVEKLSIGAGVYNILDEEIYFVQPYNGAHAAIPGSSRSYRVKLSYNLF
jgi:outer membrane receptor for ferrienterochelin and colicin